MARPVVNLRLFVAIYPPPDVAVQLIEAVRDVDGLPAHRLTPAEQVHLTLQFVGDTPVKDLDAVIESVERSAAGLARFVLVPQRLVTFPQPRREGDRPSARLVAAETDAPGALLEIQRRLAHRLSRHPRRDAGDRFTPHMTLCRFRAPKRMPPLDLPFEGLGPFAVDRIVLMKSMLGPAGARHDEVAAAALST